MEEEEQHLDYDTFLDPSFSPTSFANTLILATNNANDTPLDLTTPLSRILFDVQEVDTRLDRLTATSALPILNYTRDNVNASEKALFELEQQVAALTGSYERLEREIIHRHEQAEETRLAATRLWETVKLGREVGRCLTLGRQLEAQMSDLRGDTSMNDSNRPAAGSAAGAGKIKEDYRAMVRSANTLLSVRQVLNTSSPSGDAEPLDSVNIIRTLRDVLIEPSERAIISRAEQIVSQFSMSSLTASNPSSTSQGSETAASSAGPTYAQIEDTRSRATSALVALYLLSPVPTAALQTTPFEPSYLTSALQDYLRRAITSSLAGLTSALATLPKLERTLVEVSARCQNIVALEMLLDATKPPLHPLLPSPPSKSSPKPLTTTDVEPQAQQPAAPETLLSPLLASLDTPSLPSYFWRSMASQLSARVQKIVKDGGVSARTLRSNRERVGQGLRECVSRGSVLPGAVRSLQRGARLPTHGPEQGHGLVEGKAGEIHASSWEREAAVMVRSVMGVLER